MKKNTIPTGVVVSSVEEVILATLEGLAEAVENKEEPPFFLEGEEVKNLLLGLGSGRGNAGGRCGDKPTNFEVEPLDLEEEEEDEEEDNMVDKNLEWMI